MLSSLISFVTYGQESVNINDLAKKFFGDTASYLPSNYISKLKVYDQAEFSIVYDLSKDKDGLVLHRNNFSSEDSFIGTSDSLDGYLGLLAGVAIENGDVLSIIKSDTCYDCCRSPIPNKPLFNVFDSEFNMLSYNNGIVFSRLNGNEYTVGFNKKDTIYVSTCGGAYANEDCVATYNPDYSTFCMTFYRFRAIARYELDFPEDFTRSKLLQIGVKAYDAHGVEVPVANVSKEQWDFNRSTGRATFKPVYNYKSASPTNCTDGYLNATGIAFYIDLTTLKWYPIYTMTSERVVSTSSVHVCSSVGALSVTGIDGQPYQVYALSGQKIYDGIEEKISLPSGFYVVKFKGEAVKAVVK